MAKIYRTIQGDTWDIVSLKNYGSELFTDRLVEANFQQRKTAIFGAGVTLVIPDIPESERESSNLPPWRRNG